MAGAFDYGELELLEMELIKFGKRVEALQEFIEALEARIKELEDRDNG